jgi:hypothetical protein
MTDAASTLNASMAAAPPQRPLWERVGVNGALVLALLTMLFAGGRMIAATEAQIAQQGRDIAAAQARVDDLRREMIDKITGESRARVEGLNISRDERNREAREMREALDRTATRLAELSGVFMEMRAEFRAEKEARAQNDRDQRAWLERLRSDLTEWQRQQGGAPNRPRSSAPLIAPPELPLAAVRTLPAVLNPQPAR